MTAAATKPGAETPLGMLSGRDAAAARNRYRRVVPAFGDTGQREDLADQVLRDAVRLVRLVRTEEPAVVVGALAHYDPAVLSVLAVFLAAMVPQDQPVSALTAWFTAPMPPVPHRGVCPPRQEALLMTATPASPQIGDPVQIRFDAEFVRRGEDPAVTWVKPTQPCGSPEITPWCVPTTAVYRRHVGVGLDPQLVNELAATAFRAGRYWVGDYADAEFHEMPTIYQQFWRNLVNTIVATMLQDRVLVALPPNYGYQWAGPGDLEIAVRPSGTSWVIVAVLADEPDEPLLVAETSVDARTIAAAFIAAAKRRDHLERQARGE